MSGPDQPLLEAMLADQGLTLSETRLAMAAGTHAGMRPGITKLRALELSFFEPVIEPATALQWIDTPPKETP